MRPALLLPIALVLAACGKDAPVQSPPRPVLTQTIVPGAMATRDVYPGEIRARHETDLGFRIPGKLVSRAADAGARVKRGQVLARLDPEDARLAVQAASAQVAAAEGDLALASAELDRHAGLLEKKFISQSAFDARKNAFNAASARALQARSQAALSSNHAAYTTLLADADGVVLSVAAEPGQVLASGQPVLRLAHAGEKEVVVSVPESQLGRFGIGQAVAISIWADASLLFPGRVREIAGGADPVTRTYAVRISALNPPEQARLGMSANVLFQSTVDPTLVLLPLTAIAREGGNPAVWVVDPATGRVRLRQVSVGQFREDGVTITAGLHPGDVVVTAGVHKLRPGEAVRIAPAAAAAPAQ